MVQHTAKYTIGTFKLPGSVANMFAPAHIALNTLAASSAPLYCLLLTRTVGMIAMVLSASSPVCAASSSSSILMGSEPSSLPKSRQSFQALMPLSPASFDPTTTSLKTCNLERQHEVGSVAGNHDQLCWHQCTQMWGSDATGAVIRHVHYIQQVKQTYRAGTSASTNTVDTCIN